MVSRFRFHFVLREHKPLPLWRKAESFSMLMGESLGSVGSCCQNLEGGSARGCLKGQEGGWMTSPFGQVRESIPKNGR